MHSYPPWNSWFELPSSHLVLVQNQKTWGIGGTRTPSSSRLIGCSHLGQLTALAASELIGKALRLPFA